MNKGFPGKGRKTDYYKENITSKGTSLQKSTAAWGLQACQVLVCSDALRGPVAWAGGEPEVGDGTRLGRALYVMLRGGISSSGNEEPGVK